MDNEQMKAHLRSQEIIAQITDAEVLNKIKALFKRHSILPKSDTMMPYKDPHALLDHASYRVAKAEISTDTAHKDSDLPGAVVKAATDLVVYAETFANRERGA